MPPGPELIQLRSVPFPLQKPYRVSLGLTRQQEQGSVLDGETSVEAPAAAGSTPTGG